MDEKFTTTQRQRLLELNVSEDFIDLTFPDNKARDYSFKKFEKELIRENKDNLKELLDNKHLPILSEIEKIMTDWLTCDMGFTKIVSPIIISETMLSKMSIAEDHLLRNQVFWVDKNKCLRPMLAPNLYELMRDIHKVTKEPVRIFEIGPCFRKESQGAQHLNEFTMLNLVEFAVDNDGTQMSRLKELADLAMKALKIKDYQLETTESEVYGETLDVICGDMELASGAYGPHPLDSNWGIFDTSWVGIGFGLERIAMTKGGYSGIKRVGRSLSYLDGIRLKV